MGEKDLDRPGRWRESSVSYQQKINALIEEIKADKSIVQPWRNYATKALSEAQAFLVMGGISTYRSAPEGMIADRLNGADVCTCGPGVRDGKCPVHGDGAGRSVIR